MYEASGPGIPAGCWSGYRLQSETLTSPYFGEIAPGFMPGGVSLVTGCGWTILATNTGLSRKKEKS